MGKKSKPGDGTHGKGEKGFTGDDGVGLWGTLRRAVKITR